MNFLNKATSGHKAFIYLVKANLKYLKQKKSLFIFITALAIASILIFIPIFVTNETGSYSWLGVSLETILLFILNIFLFNILFVQSKYNQLDLLLLSKSKTNKSVFLSKGTTTIIITNVFILFNSFVMSLMFSIYNHNFSMLIPIILLSIISQNIFSIILILLFSAVLLIFGGRIAPIMFSLSALVVLAGSGFGIKIYSDFKLNSQNFNYDSNLTHSFAKLYSGEHGSIQKTIIEKTNYQGKIKNSSLKSINPILSNLNPLNWINSLPSSVISKQSSNNEVITKNIFNINQNRFYVKNNLFQNISNKNIKGIYPLNVKPLFELNHFQVQDEFKKLFFEFKNKGFQDVQYDSINTFVKNNDLWESVTPLTIKEILFSAIGIKGNINILYWLRDRKELLMKNPDLFSWMEKEFSPSFSNMYKTIVHHKNLLFNLINIKKNNRNELISLKIFAEDKQATLQDVKHFKEFVKFANNSIELNNKVIPLSIFNNVFTNITNKQKWDDYIDKQSFHLKDLRSVETKLKQIDKNITNYLFEKNDIDISTFHYEYTIETTTPILITGLSLFISLFLITTLTMLNTKKLKTANLKGF